MYLNFHDLTLSKCYKHTNQMYVLSPAKELSRQKEHLQDFQFLLAYLSISARF